MVEQATLVTSAETLALTGVLGFVSVGELEPLGIQWLHEQAATVCAIDLGAVSYSSSAGLALLLAWRRAAAQLGKTLHIKNMPTDMAALAKVGGLAELLSNN
jgi:phospholipid transport system transporter-binding protein